MSGILVALELEPLEHNRQRIFFAMKLCKRSVEVVPWLPRKSLLASLALGASFLPRPGGLRPEHPLPWTWFSSLLYPCPSVLGAQETLEAGAHSP